MRTFLPYHYEGKDAHASSPAIYLMKNHIFDINISYDFGVSEKNDQGDGPQKEPCAVPPRTLPGPYTAVILRCYPPSTELCIGRKIPINGRDISTSRATSSLGFGHVYGRHPERQIQYKSKNTDGNLELHRPCASTHIRRPCLFAR